jgi:hypothetical protein
LSLTLLIRPCSSRDQHDEFLGLIQIAFILIPHPFSVVLRELAAVRKAIVEFWIIWKASLDNFCNGVEICFCGFATGKDTIRP